MPIITVTFVTLLSPWYIIQLTSKNASYIDKPVP